MNKQPFLVAGGSVPGVDHIKPLKRINSHDAFRFTHYGDSCLALVSDGNGSLPDNEVGAKLGVRLYTANMESSIPKRNTLH